MAGDSSPGQRFSADGAYSGRSVRPLIAPIPLILMLPKTLPRIHRFLLSVAALMTLLAASEARALVFGEIRSSSRFGELLHAEIEIEEDASDRFDASCVKLYRPLQASADLPWITEARLSFRREDGKGKLYISSDRPLRDPVVQIGVQSSCIGGRVWRDYTFLVSPAVAASREPSVAPSARPVPAATPAPAVSTRKIDRVTIVAPHVMDAKAGAKEPSLRLASWDAADPVRQSRTSSRGVIDSVLPLRMSVDLSAADSSSELARDVLRLEYRMLKALHEQADSQLALAEKLRQMETGAGELKAVAQRLGATDALLPTPTPTPTVSVPSEPMPTSALPAPTEPAPVALRVVPKAPPEAIAPETSADAADGLVYVGLGAVLLFVLVIAMRRRREAVLVEPVLPMHAPTLIAEHPEFLRTPEQALAEPSVDDGPENMPLPEPAAAALAVPPSPESQGLTPVMELAEIMLSFGRVNGAAQTLQEYLETDPKAALEPWMRLLEIYRDNGMRADFDAVATNLHHNFNVEVVHWDAAASGERVEMSLELLPHIRDQIDTLWGKPECFDYLQRLLRDNRDGERGGFTLPVVKEILLLIDLMVAEKAAAE